MKPDSLPCSSDPRPMILLVEDDHALRTGLRDSFEQEGWRVCDAADGLVAAELLVQERFDLVVLDLMLPGRNGLDLLRDLRRDDLETPVLILTARGDEGDKVLGLELGADDYVAKPFGLRELLARVRALLRRSSVQGERKPRREFEIGTSVVDLDAFEVRGPNGSAALSTTEAAMLELLHQHVGKVVSRQRFLEVVWGGRFVGNRTIDTHMLNLRKKLESDPKTPQHLLTAHGHGYKLTP